MASATALDGIEMVINLVRAVERHVNDWKLVDVAQI